MVSCEPLLGTSAGMGRMMDTAVAQKQSRGSIISVKQAFKPETLPPSSAPVIASIVNGLEVVRLCFTKVMVGL